MKDELSATIARLRRSQPRNADTNAVCDALEVRIVADGRLARLVPSSPAKELASSLAEVDCPECRRRREQTLARVRKVRAKNEQAR